MYFANPVGLLGLLSLPVIAGIHLYHRRFPPRLVAGLHLWGVEVRQPTAGRKRDSLPITPSLLIELLAALVLTLILSQPRAGDGRSVSHLVAVLDNSASMASVGGDGVSCRDRAVDEIRRRMNSESRDSVVTVILTGRRPVMLAGPAVKWEEAEQRLDRWAPSDTRHDMLPALDMASQMAESGGDVLFVTDTLPGEQQRIQPDIEVVAVGQSLSNVAITAARWTLDRTNRTGQVFARIANLGPRPVEVRVTGVSGAEGLFSSQLTLSAAGEESFQTSVPAGTGQLELRIESDGDPLAIDNRVSLIEPRLRVVRVANLLPQDSFSGRSCRRVLDAVPDLVETPASDADLVIGPASELPESRGSLWWLGVGLDQSTDAAKLPARDLLGPYLIEKRHPLMQGILLGGVVWAGVQAVPYAGSPLISAGDHWLLMQLDGTETTAYLLNIELQRSNLTDSPDWPILMSNLIELRRSSLPGLERWNYRLNENISFRLFADAVESEQAAERALALKSTRGSRPLARSPVVDVPPPASPGVYTVLDGPEQFGQFAVNFFDPEESTLTPLGSGVRTAVKEDQKSAFAVHHSDLWLILCGVPLLIALVLADWFVLRRRRL